MEKTEKFFIFTWKELIVIVLLVLTLLGFFFTLGLHYGKKIHVGSSQPTEETEKLEESPETLPPREALEEGSQHTKAVASDTIKEATEEEVEHTGVKLDSPKAVDLPSEKVKPSAAHHEAPTHEAVEEHASEPKAAFAIQLGSYATKKEALQKSKIYSKRGVETDIRTAEVNHQTRYRVVISGFKSKTGAEQRGKELKQKHKIENFIVIK